MAVHPEIQAFDTNMRQYFSDLENAIRGLGGDIQGLNAKIAQLQNTQGAINQEDQGILDSIQVLAQDASAKFKALDELTPPAATTPPAEPPIPPVNPA